MSKLNRREFKELLAEWKINFINERNVEEFKSTLTYPCYLIRTLNYGDLKYDSIPVNDSTHNGNIPKSNEHMYPELLQKSLKKEGIEFTIDDNDIPYMIIQVDIEGKSIEEKKHLTRKVVDAIYETSKSDELKEYETDLDFATKHPPLSQDDYNTYLNKSLQDIENTFDHMKNTNNHEAPIFISHLNYENNIYYAVHDIIGHGSIERSKFHQAPKESSNFAYKLYKIENNPLYSHYRYNIQQQLQRLTPDVGENDISSSLVSYFASINHSHADIIINNFFKNSIIDDRKREIINILKDLYKDYKADIKRAEKNVTNSTIGRYANMINICFIYLEF